MYKNGCGIGCKEWTKTTDVRKWKYVDSVTLLTCVSKDKLLSRMD